MWLSFIAILSFHCFIGEAWHTTPPNSLSSTTIQYNSTTTRPSRKPTVRIYPGFLAAKIIMLILIATCFCCAGNQWLRRRGYYMQDPGNSYQPFAPFNRQLHVIWWISKLHSALFELYYAHLSGNEDVRLCSEIIAEDPMIWSLPCHEPNLQVHMIFHTKCFSGSMFPNLRVNEAIMLLIISCSKTLVHTHYIHFITCSPREIFLNSCASCCAL